MTSSQIGNRDEPKPARDTQLAMAKVPEIAIADWLDNPRHLGGLALGTGPVAVALTVAIVGFVGYLTVTRVDVTGKRPTEHLPPHPHPTPVLELELD
jgi:hypothetical protein